MSSLALPRRRFLTSLTALIAAPAIVRVSSLMPVRGWEETLSSEEIIREAYGRLPNSLLTINAITREAVALFKRSNAFLVQIDREYERQDRVYLQTPVRR